MHYFCQNLVPEILTHGNKDSRITLAGGLITMAEQDTDFSNNMITGDEV
jgi:hypothetical protein